MRRLRQTFSRLSQEGNTGLITFITAGDPNPDVTVPAMHALARHGADVIELGVPFTDPEADGPAIQQASERALAHGVTLRQTCEMVASFRTTNQSTPVVLMGYLNPILALGTEQFVRLARVSGVDGMIIVNLPYEEAAEMSQLFTAYGIDLILLVAPTTPNSRISRIAAIASGFLYYVSIKGITGSNHLDVNDVATHLGAISQLTDLPIAVGFGIKTPQMAAAVATDADAVVVGSALVNLLGTSESAGEAIERVQALTAAIKRAITVN